MKHTRAVENMRRWLRKCTIAYNKRLWLESGVRQAIEHERHCQEKYAEYVKKANEEA